MEIDDLELVRKAAGGDEKAFHTLVDRHAQGLFRVALNLTPTRSDAEDLCQETFAGAFVGLSRFNGQASVKTWLTRILMRQAAKAWHKGKRHRKNLSIDAPDGADIAYGSESGAGGLTVPPAQLAVDQKMDLTKILDTLDPPHKEVLLLREMQGLSYEEIAQTLDIPRGTVESRLHRARAELRGKLKDYRP